MKYLFFLSFLFLSTGVYSQDFYNMDNIQTIEVTFAESNWDQLMDNAYAADAGYIMAQSVAINGVSYDSVGVKYKGNSSYSANQVKNPWHIELDTYKDQEYEGYTDIKLASGYKDPSFLRDVLAYQIVRQYMEAPQANFANLYVNGNLIGLYANTESISKKFVNNRFGSKDNPFFKCSPPGGAGPQSNNFPNLVYMGQDSTDYYDSYELKTDAGWQRLIDLCDTLANHTEDIENILDLDKALWMLAFDNTIVNLDSYIGAFAQNYYLYQDDYGRFLPVVWDLNESFGVFSSTGTIRLDNTADKQQMTHLLHENDSQYPLVQKLLSIPMYKRMYLAHMKTLVLENFDNGAYYNSGLALQATIDEAVQADGNKFFTYANFTSNLTTDIGGGGGPGGGRNSTPGITNLMDGRNDYLLGLSDFTQTQPTITDLALSNAAPIVNETITITATVTDENDVYLAFRTEPGAPFTRIEMYDDGAHNDGAANDGIYGVDLVITNTLVHYYIYAENDVIGRFSPERAAHEYHSINATRVAGDVVINELMASNDMTAADQDGEFDDWIELYNNTSDPIDLGGYFLSDDSDNLTAWAFPQGTQIATNGFLIVWADDDLDQSGLHTNFRLSAAGESVFLSNPGGTIIDEVSYVDQITDLSFARIPNGTGDFIVTLPTFNTNNESGVDCSGLGGDADNDGVCTDNDCDDNDPLIGATQAAGTVCDDGDSTTDNDQIQSDGCTCAGTPIDLSDVVINELMASNEETVGDQDGEFDDWVELYNNSDQRVDLSGYFLTDDSENLTKWTFPAGTAIEAKDYLIIWADEDDDQSGLHADFKLSASGESVLLVDPSGTNIVDATDFSEQDTDISYGRFPNGTGDFRTMPPTFNAENTISSNTYNLADEAVSITAYPNPTNELFNLEVIGEEPVERSVEVYSLNGILIYQNTMWGNIQIDVSDWSAGMYLVRVEDAFLKMVVK